jgi:hypothetical protein
MRMYFEGKVTRLKSGDVIIIRNEGIFPLLSIDRNNQNVMFDVSDAASSGQRADSERQCAVSDQPIDIFQALSIVRFIAGTHALDAEQEEAVNADCFRFRVFNASRRLSET